jgi:hypothetical protein
MCSYERQFVGASWRIVTMRLEAHHGSVWFHSHNRGGKWERNREYMEETKCKGHR